jgi:tRNA nucleotidyltransferase (CCA-adding enzyme)
MDLITTHVNADFDCLGAMVAAKKLYPNGIMAFAGAQERSLREFFQRGGADPKEFRRPKEIDLEAIDRLILVDVRQSDRIGPFGEIARRPGVEIHIYDHHAPAEGDLKGSVEYFEPVGSTVTVLTHLFMERGIEPSADEATIMMLGLYEDTGSLLFSSTTVRDYQAAAFLLSHGARLNAVADYLVQELTPEQVSLLHQLIENRTVYNLAGVEVSVAHASSDHFVGDLAVLAHKLRDMENLEALIVVARMGGRIFMVARSRTPEVHVGEILAEFGGGGHSFAAAGAVRDRTLVEVLEHLPMVLTQHVQPRKVARHLMSFPVKTVKGGEQIRAVRDFLNRYNVNALPVMEGERIAGLITRQVVDKAAHHGLEEEAVEEFMSREFLTVDPDTPIETLRELVIEGSQRFVPVVENGHLVGAVTRTDLLRHMVAGGRDLAASRFAPADAPGVKRRNITRLLKDKLPARIYEMLMEMGEIGDRLGVSIFAVGGFVRDLLLRKENLDIDIVVEGDGIAFAAAYARSRKCRIRTHRKFGTAVIIFPDGFKVDVASTRMEYYVAPAALPTVEHASIKLDLYRRDFTINTLAVALNGKWRGELIDHFGAQRDLKDRAIRVLHNLSFVEDPTRVFRAIRFEQRLGFHLGRHTEHLLRSAVRLGLIEKVGGSRVLNELTIILCEADPLPAVLRLESLDLIKYIHPALTTKHRVRSLFERAGRVLHWYELLYTGEEIRKWLVYLLSLAADLDRDAMVGICRRLDVPPRVRTVLTETREDAHLLLQRLERRRAQRTTPRNSDLYHELTPFPTEIILYLMAAAGDEEVRRWLSRFFTHLRGTTHLLTGDDLKGLGLPPGPLYKKVFTALLNARLNGQVLTRQEEMALVRRRFLKQGKEEKESASSSVD